MDFYPLSPTLFTLNEPCCAELEAPGWNQALFNRLSEGLISVNALVPLFFAQVVGSPINPPRNLFIPPPIHIPV